MDRREFVALLGGACLCGAAGGVSRSARAQEQLTHQVTLYDPSGEALRRFHTALGQRRTRIMVWGASHVSEDGFTSYLRSRLTARFGDAGPGLVLPARPFEFYDHRDVRIAPTGRWRPVRVRGRHRAPDDYGPAGIAIETARAATAFVRPRRAVETAQLFYLAQPGGGTVDLSVNGSDATTLRTDGRGVRSHTLAAPELREARLATRGDGPVRIFGVSLERSRDGVIVDPLGSPGARFRDRLPWRDRGMARQLRELGPDLLVLAYGTNETGFRGRPRAVYHREVSEAVRRARLMSPEASCVIIGPSDWPERGPGGERRARPRTHQVIEVQRAVAREHGCGHFDLVALQGGPGSMPRWVRAGLALPDHVHFTDRGHRALARALTRALVPGA